MITGPAVSPAKTANHEGRGEGAGRYRMSISNASLIYEHRNLALLAIFFCASSHGLDSRGRPGVDCFLIIRLANPGISLNIWRVSLWSSMPFRYYFFDIFTSRGLLATTCATVDTVLRVVLSCCTSAWQ